MARAMARPTAYTMAFATMPAKVLLSEEATSVFAIPSE